MFGDVQHTIRDTQYRDALKYINKSPPERQLPKPAKEDLAIYGQSKKMTITRLLDSPIGVYFMKNYLKNYLNVAIVVDFLVQYQKVETFLAVNEEELKDLIVLAELLPAPFKSHVSRINEQLRKIEEGQKINFNFTEESVESGYSSSSRPFITRQEEHQDEGNSQNDVGIKKRKKIFGIATTNLFSRLRREKVKTLGNGAENLVSFGGGGYRKKPNEIFRKLPVEFAMLEAEDKFDTESNIDFESVLEEEEENKKEEEEDKESITSAKEILLKLMQELHRKLYRRAKGYFISFRESKEYQNMLSALWYADQRTIPNDFRKFRVLGKGAFGAVSGVKHKYTGQLVAIKMMNKKLVKGKRALSLVYAEKEVLEILGDNPSSFTVWLKYAFQDKDYYYMAIPLCTGGDLAFHLDKAGSFDLNRLRFHAAEVLEGLSHLHSLGIVYRDLKPENIILDTDGHCRISDMGLAAIIHQRTIKGRAGTPGYWAPEVICKKRYSYGVDIWSLGVLMFEMAIGICPFSQTNSGMPRDVATRKWPVKYPQYLGFADEVRRERNRFPDDLKSLLKGLLKRRASRRFGERTIRDHPFFSSINWDRLRQRQIKPPFVPADNKVNATSAKKLEGKKGERQYRNVKLSAQDVIPNFDYTSKYAHQLDVVNTLILYKTRPDLMFKIKRGSIANKNSSKLSVIKSLGTLMSSSSSKEKQGKKDNTV